MEDVKPDPIAQVDELTKQLNTMKRQLYAKMIGSSLKFAAKAYVIAAMFIIGGAVILKPIWVAAKWLWNLY